MAPQPLPQAFCARDAREVAPALLGKRLCCGAVMLRITEVEAYYQPGDTASHCRMGRTARNAPMWGPAGHAYVYLCYGIHRMLNIVTDGDGLGAAVLVRACAPLTGLSVVRERRGGMRGPVLLTGPGKVGAALGLSTRDSGAPMFTSDAPLTLCDGPAPAGILVGPRVGIGYASPADQRAPLRFAEADSPWVSQRRTLVPAD